MCLMYAAAATEAKMAVASPRARPVSKYCDASSGAAPPGIVAPSAAKNALNSSSSEDMLHHTPCPTRSAPVSWSYCHPDPGV